MLRSDAARAQDWAAWGEPAAGSPLFLLVGESLRPSADQVSYCDAFARTNNAVARLRSAAVAPASPMRDATTTVIASCAGFASEANAPRISSSSSIRGVDAASSTVAAAVITTSHTETRRIPAFRVPLPGDRFTVHVRESSLRLESHSNRTS